MFPSGRTISGGQFFLLLVCTMSGLLSFFSGYMLARTHKHTSDCGSEEEMHRHRYIHPSMMGSDLEVKTETSKNTISSSSGTIASSSAPYEMSLVMNQRKKTDGALLYEESQPNVLISVFNMYGHPNHPMTSELLLRRQDADRSIGGTKDPYAGCESIYLTRTGSLANMPNKCLSIIPTIHYDPIPHSHRKGKIAGHLDQYLSDNIDNHALQTESLLLPPFLAHFNELKANLSAIFTQRDKDYQQRHKDSSAAPAKRPVIVMVLNEGVLDVFLNFLCSLDKADIGYLKGDLIIFSGQESVLPVLSALSVKCIYSPFLGRIPKKAADFYGDMTFAYLMWLKSNSVYLALSTGFPVLFQDVDLVWLQDPMPYLSELQRSSQSDILFMDDGARTPRFTPLYVNSGFYYIHPSPQAVYTFHRILQAVAEIAVSHSHQSVLTRYVMEAMHLRGLTFSILDMRLFPSGYLYHHEVDYMLSLKEYKLWPFLFHMCWTESRKQKVEYLDTLGMWFLPNNSSRLYGQCTETEQMRKTYLIGEEEEEEKKQQEKKIYEDCCLEGEYWRKRKEFLAKQPSS